MMFRIKSTLSGVCAGMILGLAGTAAPLSVVYGAETLSYKPPATGAPTRRIGGGTRGVARAGKQEEDLKIDTQRGVARGVARAAGEAEKFFMSVLTPQGTAYSSVAQPNLYWAISEDEDATFEVAVNKPMPENPNIQEPVIEKQFTVDKAGVSAVSLSELGLKLESDTQYTWHIAMILDPKSRSLDIATSGTIQYKPLPEDLSAQIEKAEPAEAARLYAENGYWYDAMDLLAKQIEANPDNADLRAMRKSLLEQVELPEKIVAVATQ